MRSPLHLRDDPRVHTDFRRAFTDGSLFWDPDRKKTLKVAVEHVGEISFQTGVIVVADPSFVDPALQCLPLLMQAPVGRWPAEVTVVTEEGSAEVGGTVAAMRVRFGTAAATAWAPVLMSDEGEVLGVGVDGGRIALFDRRLLEHATPDAISAACFGSDSLASVVDFPNSSEAFVSDAGKGDGCYPVWWGTTGNDVAVEIVVEFDVLVRTPTSSISVPAALLREQGTVMAPELAIAGVAMEVRSADEVQGPWAWDFSSFPEETRPDYERPAIGLALRVKGPVSRLTLFDASGEWVGVNPGSIGPHADGFRTEFWQDDPRLVSAHTLALEIVGEVEALGSPH